MKTAAFLLIVFSGFFLNVTPTSPIYVTFIVAALIIGYIIGKRKHIKVNKYSKILTVFFAYIIVVYFVFMQKVTNTTFNVIFSLVYGIFTTLAIQEIKSSDIVEYCIYSFRFAVVLLYAEAIWRWTHPVWEKVLAENDILYYQYKRSSIMYADSNFVGVYALILYFFVLYIEQIADIDLKKYKILFTIATLLTLSKAACLILFFSYFYSLKKISIGTKIVVSVAVLGLAISPIMQQLLKDGSLLGKLTIVTNAVEYMKGVSRLEYLFGIGFGYLADLKFTSGHNLIVTFVIESGVIGLMMLFCTWFAILKVTRYRGGIVLIPFFLVAMSLAPHAIPYVYAMLAVIYILTIRLKPGEKVSISIKKGKGSLFKSGKNRDTVHMYGKL